MQRVQRDQTGDAEALATLGPLCRHVIVSFMYGITSIMPPRVCVRMCRYNEREVATWGIVFNKLREKVLVPLNALVSPCGPSCHCLMSTLTIRCVPSHEAVSLCQLSVTPPPSYSSFRLIVHRLTSTRARSTTSSSSKWSSTAVRKPHPTQMHIHVHARMHNCI